MQDKLKKIMKDAGFNLVEVNPEKEEGCENLIEIHYKFNNHWSVLHTQGKDSTFGDFSHIYKYLCQAGKRKHLFKEKDHKRLQVMGMVNRILDSTISIQPKEYPINLSNDRSNFLNQVLECLNLDADLFDSLTRLKTSYIELIAKRDNLHYFTFDDAENEFCFGCNGGVTGTRSEFNYGLIEHGFLSGYIDALYKRNEFFYENVLTS
jgi:hypothetical protein